MIILCAVVDVFVDIYMKNVKSSGMKKLDLLKNLLLRTESLNKQKMLKKVDLFDIHRSILSILSHVWQSMRKSDSYN